MSTSNGLAQSSEIVDILILGAGWTSTFLIPLCDSRSITHVATSRPASRKPDTIPFEFDQTQPEADKEQFARLPDARTVLITFPITVQGASERLVRAYEQTRTPHNQVDAVNPRFIQLGTTSVFDIAAQAKTSVWSDRHSPIDETHLRGKAEQELLALSPGTPTTVLDLAGLWGGARKAKHFIGRIAPTKEALENRGSVHMIHGEDVSRAILAVHEDFGKANGERWLLTDGRVYDWWDLAYAWGIAHATAKGAPVEDSQGVEKDRGPHPRWVRELMRKRGIRALPRSVEQLGKGLDSRDFWDTFELEPIKGRLE